jgi:MFS family permease
MWLKKPLPAALILVLLWTVCRLAFLWHTGIPEPSTHDEFSYLLGADTFADGRLANPPHMLGKFFESPHILVRPVYASKYPPGQALFLALGQRLFGSAFYGVLIGNALMLFTFCLLLFAWVPSPWALAVSAMFGLCLSPLMYWTNSYWGGSVTASGGALVLLGMGVYRARQTPLAGAIFAIGVLLLFWTRPFEGGVFTLIVLMVFAQELWRTLRASVFVATVSVLAVGGAWTCYDNQAVTGNPFRLPYLLHDRQYNVTPVFWFLPLRPEPTYSHPRLASQHGTGGWEATVYKGKRPRWQFLGTGLIASLRTLELSLRTAVLLTLLVPVAWRDPLYRKMAIVAGVSLLALSAETFHFEHYTAPAWAALALMIAVWAKHAWNLRIRKQPVGVALVLLALTSPAIVTLSSRVPRLLQRTSSSFGGDSRSMPPPSQWPKRRGTLIERLSALDRRQLVIVRYPSPDWNIRDEWVYNGADIDHQRVVFAHDLGMEQNRVLLNYYSDRTALLLTFDSASGQEQIEPYPPAPSQQ